MQLCEGDGQCTKARKSKTAIPTARRAVYTPGTVPLPGTPAASLPSAEPRRILGIRSPQGVRSRGTGALHSLQHDSFKEIMPLAATWIDLEVVILMK